MLLNFIVQMGTVVSNMAWSADKSFLLYFQPEEEFHPSDFSPLKKGLLWQQRDKLFSRWKERYFVLTKDYFHCFKKATSKITEMGGFIFKVRNLLIINFFRHYVNSSPDNWAPGNSFPSQSSVLYGQQQTYSNQTSLPGAAFTMS